MEKILCMNIECDKHIPTDQNSIKMWSNVGT